MGTTTFCDICKKQKNNEEFVWNSINIQAKELENVLKIQGLSSKLDLCDECGIILIPKIMKILKEQIKE